MAGQIEDAFTLDDLPIRLDEGDMSVLPVFRKWGCSAKGLI
jgi:hypothetical protein